MQCLCVLSVLALLSCATVHADEEALVTEKVFMDLEMAGHTERIIIGLFGSTSPKTVRNFVGLVNHEVSESLVSMFFISDWCVFIHRKDLVTESLPSIGLFQTS